MAKLYQEWTIDDDRLLWENRKRSLAEQAALLGRGLRGVESRLRKLRNVDSPAYARLFAGGGGRNTEDDDSEMKPKLIPVSEVLRRIQYDYTLPEDEFSIVHYDRVEDTLVESPFLAPNESVKGKASLLIDALPEHRIMAVKYREQVVWDRERRVDLIFGGHGMDKLMAGYDEWKAQKDAAEEWNRQRQIQVANDVQSMLGLRRFAELEELSQSLQEKVGDSTVSIKIEVEKYVEKALTLFQQVRADPASSMDPSRIPRTDYEAVDVLSELVALFPDNHLRPVVLSELSLAMLQAQGKKVETPMNRELPPLAEEDLVETFVRGSGPGGQKINKTANRVVLVHTPTNLRVECQETRSLPQNRKIARQRLRVKLDEWLHGRQSKESAKAQRASTKKSKAKVRSRARQRRKQEAKSTEQTND